MEIHIAWDRADLWSETSNLVCQHAGSGNLNRIIPIVVVVAKCVSKVKDSHFGNLWGVFRHVKVSGFNGTLSHRVRNQEEVKFAVNNFGLFDKTLIYICALWGILDEVLTIAAHRLLEESLAHSLVHNNQSDLRGFQFLDLAAFNFNQSVFNRDDVM